MPLLGEGRERVKSNYHEKPLFFFKIIKDAG
jgi:hypothetical protein